MKTTSPLVFSVALRNIGLAVGAGVLCALIAFPLARRSSGAPPPRQMDRGGGGGGGMDRFSHGSVRHESARIAAPPVERGRPPEVRPEPEHRPVPVPRPEVRPRPDVFLHRDVDADIHRHRPWDDFVFGRRLPALPPGVFSLRIGATPYFYNDGIYYEQAAGGYQEVYPPVGASIPQLPDGAVVVNAGGQTYYYVGGAFYVQQADGTYVTAPPPLGVVVPELPPGAVQVSANGQTAYQFNGIYYEPVFVNGVTQCETFKP